ncbi:signal peptidase II [Williamsia herbipolensis]|uniref:signal peptidase II n=1 Tax=Williamsia herbipolensis TaxID=1603258 RepID=UPI0005F87D87|nr:signal peptidase II [Williamsia herbipolensis]
MRGVATDRLTRTQHLRWVFVVLSATLVAVPLLVEPLARRRLGGGGTFDLGPLQLKLAYNSGVAFSFGDRLPAWVILAVTATITLVVGAYTWCAAATSSPALVVALSVVFAGAGANVIDRAADGKVTDYFHTGWWPTFNLADVYIIFGLVLLLGALWRDSTPDP